MDRSVIVSELEEFKKQVIIYEQVSTDYEQAKEKLEKAKQYVPQRLSEFDEKYFPEFVESKIGNRNQPKEFGFLDPRRFSKKAIEKRNNEIDKHNKIMSELKRDFDLQYEKKREGFKKADEEEKALKVQSAEEEFLLKEKELKIELSKVESVNLLPKSMFSSVIIDRLMNYFSDWRVDSMKEAINLYFDEFWKQEESRKISGLFKGLEEKLIENNSLIMKVSEDSDKVIDSLSELSYSVDDLKSKIDSKSNN